MTDFSELGGLIKAGRLVQRKSLREVAQEVGIHFTLLSKMENNRLSRAQWPSAEKLMVLCDVLVLRKAIVLAAAHKIPRIITEALMDEKFMEMCLLMAYTPICDNCGRARVEGHIDSCVCLGGGSDNFIRSMAGVW